MADVSFPPGEDVGYRGSGSSRAAEGVRTGGRSSYAAGDRQGRLPWGWRWLGIPLVLCACMLAGWWGWGKMERGLHDRALAHLACEDVDTSAMSLDWSYRSVKVDGALPDGVTATQVENIIRDGSTNSTCLEGAGISADDNPGVRDVQVLAAAGAAAVTVAEPEVEVATPDAEVAVDAVEETAAMTATASFDGRSISLVGSVPTVEQRQILVDAARRSVGAENVDDRLTIADGEPSDTAAGQIDDLAAVIAYFDAANVLEGSASATDDALTYDLLASTEDVKASLELPGSGTVSVAEVMAEEPPAAEPEEEPTPEPEEEPAAPAATDDPPAGEVSFTG